jgi:hypothetical protein
LYRSDNKPANSFSVTDPIRLDCSFDVRRHIEGLQFSFSVFNFKGDRIFYSSVSMAKPTISVEAAGQHHITALIPARLLLPGRYSITVALHTPKTKLYDVRKQSLGFRVLGTMTDRYDGFSGEDLGQVHADVIWGSEQNGNSSARESGLVSSSLQPRDES